MTTVLLRSSGIDSHCIEHLIKPDLSVYFDLCHTYNKHEMLTLPAHVIIDNSLDLHAYIQNNYILPRRNALLVLAAAYYGDTIILGTTQGDSTKDKDTGFVLKMNQLLAYMGSDTGKCTPAHVTTPFSSFTKKDIVKKYLDDGGMLLSLLKTRSCYNIGVKECGACRSCIRKYVALLLNDIDCSCEMEKDPRYYLRAALEYAIKQERGQEVDDIQQAIHMRT